MTRFRVFCCVIIMLAAVLVLALILRNDEPHRSDRLTPLDEPAPVPLTPGPVSWRLRGPADATPVPRVIEPRSLLTQIADSETRLARFAADICVMRLINGEPSRTHDGKLCIEWNPATATEPKVDRTVYIDFYFNTTTVYDRKIPFRVLQRGDRIAAGVGFSNGWEYSVYLRSGRSDRTLFDDAPFMFPLACDLIAAYDAGEATIVSPNDGLETLLAIGRPIRNLQESLLNTRQVVVLGRDATTLRIWYHWWPPAQGWVPKMVVSSQDSLNLSACMILNVRPNPPFFSIDSQAVAAVNDVEAPIHRWQGLHLLLPK